MEKHTIMGNKVHFYRRENRRLWRCSTYPGGRNHRVSTKEDGLSRTKEFAEEWCLELRGKLGRGELKHGKTFKDGAEQFTRKYEVMTQGQRNAKYVQDHQSRLRNHLIPFFRNLGRSEVTTGKAQDYRFERLKVGNERQPPSRSTMHHEIVRHRRVLKAAVPRPSD